MLQRYVYFVQCIHKTHSQHVNKMQGNIRIVPTLSILKKKKNTVTTDWTENKINKVHNAYLCFIEFKKGNCSEKKTLLALFCIVCQYVISRYCYNFQYQYISTCSTQSKTLLCCCSWLICPNALKLDSWRFSTVLQHTDRTVLLSNTADPSNY